MPLDLAAQRDALVAELPPLADRPGAIRVTALASGPAEVELYGEVGWDLTARGVREAIKPLAGRDLTIRVNSVGGSVFEGFAIYNLLARHQGHKTIIVEALAASIAAFFTMAADEIQMPQASFMMIHNSSGGAFGDRNTMADMIKVLERIDALQRDVFAARTGLEPEVVTAMLDAETWLTAEEAVAQGFADSLQEAPAGVTAKAPFTARAADLVARFRNAPEPIVAMARAATPPAAPAQPEEVSLTATTTPAGTPAATTIPVTPTAVAQPPLATQEPAVTQNAPQAATLAEIQAIAARARLGSDFIVAQLAAAATAAAVQDAAIDALAAAAPQRTAGINAVGQDQRVGRREAMEHALLARAGIKGADLQKGRDFMGMSLAEMGREALTAMGGNTRGMDRMELAGAALGMPNFMAAAGLHTTSDFPLVLANVARKTLLNAYGAVVQDWRPLVTVSSHADYKPVSYARMGDAPDLLETGEHQPYTYGTMSESGEKLQIKKYGRIFGVTRELLINDDLGAFTRLPAQFGTSAARAIRKAFWAMFVAPPTLSDGVAFYHANHGNLAAAGGPINPTTVGAARKAMRTQKNQDGNPIDVQPRYLVVSPDKETEAQTFLASDTLSDQSRNIFANSLTLIVSPYLTGNTWYILATPAETEGFFVTFLNGREEPRVEERVGFEVDGLEIKAAIDFGVGAIDFRGAYKNPGA
jgi:ATP-dependent protease ClpP protease subunit/phage major head subunit gpT-like protein